MNVELLRHISRHIQEEPRRLDMNITLNKLDRLAEIDDMPPCGTVGCIAGWACVLTDQIPNNFIHVLPTAMKAIGLSDIEADRLFAEPTFAFTRGGAYKAHWPTDLANRYEAAETAQEKADVTVERIERFIATEGKE